MEALRSCMMAEYFWVLKSGCVRTQPYCPSPGMISSMMAKNAGAQLRNPVFPAILVTQYFPLSFFVHLIKKDL